MHCSTRYLFKKKSRLPICIYLRNDKILVLCRAITKKATWFSKVKYSLSCALSCQQVYNRTRRKLCVHISVQNIEYFMFSFKTSYKLKFVERWLNVSQVVSTKMNELLYIYDILPCIHNLFSNFYMIEP